MTEQFVNLAQSALVDDMDDTTDPVTFDVVGAASFPTSGNFRVLIDAELFLVTSVSGNTFTADRAQEGTEVAAHTAGAQTTHILTAQSLANIVAEGSAPLPDIELFFRKTAREDLFVSPAVADDDALLAPIDLNLLSQYVTHTYPVTTDPDVCRTLSVTFSGSLTGPFDYILCYIQGSRHGEPVFETLGFFPFFFPSGTRETTQAFDHVDTFGVTYFAFAPPLGGAGTVSVGTGSKLGLRVPSKFSGNGSFTTVDAPDLNSVSTVRRYEGPYPTYVTYVGIPEILNVIVGADGLITNPNVGVGSGEADLGTYGTLDLSVGSYPIDGVRTYLIPYYWLEWVGLRRLT